MRSKLNLTLGLDNDIESFEFENELSRFSVKPNTSLRMTVAINHKFLNLKFGFSPKFLASGDSNEKGSTKLFRFAFNIFIKNWMQVFEFSNVSGYYIEDITGDNFSLFQDSDYFLLPDMKTRSFRGVTSYKFNDNFSIRSITNRSEIQRKSGGVLFLVLIMIILKCQGVRVYKKLRLSILF